MSNEDITLSVRKLLEGCGISDTLPTETACLQAFRAPQSALFAIQTATLSKFMRVLKSKAVSDKAKQNIEESFMKLVTKDNGCLPQILGHIARDLRDTTLMDIIHATGTNASTTSASTSSSSSSVPAPSTVTNPASTNVPTVPTVLPTTTPSSIGPSLAPSVVPSTINSAASSVMNTPSRSTTTTTNTYNSGNNNSNGMIAPPQLQQPQGSASRRIHSNSNETIVPRRTPTGSSTNPSNGTHSLPSSTASVPSTISIVPPNAPGTVSSSTATSSSSVTNVRTINSSSQSTPLNRSQPTTPTRSAMSKSSHLSQPHGTTTTTSTKTNVVTNDNKPLLPTVAQPIKDIMGTRISSSLSSPPPSIVPASVTSTRTTTIQDNTVILNLLQSYAKDTSLPLSSTNFTDIDTSILRYGSVIAVRSQDSSLFLSAPFEKETNGSSSSSTLYASHSFANDQDNVFTILHAASHVTNDTDTSLSVPYKGIPVRCGDSILLKSIKTQRYLSLPSNTPSSSVFPDRASTDAKDIVLVSSPVPTVNERWTIVSPTALCLAIKVYENSWSSVVPRPYLCANSPILLLAHGYGSTTTLNDDTAKNNPTIDVVSSALAATSRLQILVSGSVPRSVLHASSNGNASKPSNRTTVSSPAVTPAHKPYVDIASTVIYTDSMGKGPLASTVLAHTLCTSALPETLWNFLPLPPHYHYVPTPNKGGTTTYHSNNNYVPLNWFNDSVTSIPSLTGSHLLPLELVETLYTSATSLPLVTSTGYRMLSSHAQFDTLPSVETLPQPTESVLILALLDALQGLPSVWIRPTLSSAHEDLSSLDWSTVCTGSLIGTLLEYLHFELVPHPAFSPATANTRAGVAAPLAALIERILPLARSVVRCTWYVERRNRTGGGLTVQALTSAVRALLQEFTHLLVRLEALVLYPKPGTPSLSIQELWYYLQSSVHTMQALDTILYTSPYAIGGDLLNSVTRFITSSGDENIRTLATFLLEKASTPLLGWLENWIFNGVLQDAYHEFFIREHPLRSSSSSSTSSFNVDWENQFTIDPTLVPIFLLPHTHTILLSGKYLYVLRLCRSKADSVHLYGTFMNKLSNGPTYHTLGPLQANTRVLPVLNDKPKRETVPSSPSLARTTGTRSSPLVLKDGTSSSSSLPTVLSPSKTSTVIGADVHIARELAPSETVSVLDSVFNSRRQSVASTVMTTDTSHIPAAGLPTVSVSSSNALYGVNTERVLTEANDERKKQKSPSSAVITSPHPRGLPNDNASVVTMNEHNTISGNDAITVTDPGAPLNVWLQAALATSKIQSIGKPLCPSATKLLFSLDPQVYTTHIQNAYAYASRALLEYLYTVPPPRLLSSSVTPGTVRTLESTGGDLLGRLSTLKTFFLMAQGDWVIHFFDLVDEELQKDVLTNNPLPMTGTTPHPGTTGITVSIERLRNYLDMALRSSSSIASDDPYRQDISVTLAPSSLLAQLDHLLSNGQKPLPTAIKGLKGFNVFCLDFRVPWPASLILSPSVLTKYQILFRHLFFLRYVERSIALSWTSHQGCKELGTNIRILLSVSYALRQRMLHFLQNMTYFVTVEVIEPRWHEFVLALRSSSTVDDVLQAHTQFLENTIAASLLTSPDLLKLLTKLVTLCLLFSEQMTKAIEDHRLTEAELDARVGLNRAGERARSQRERGVYFTADEDEKGTTEGNGMNDGHGNAYGGGGKGKGGKKRSVNDENNGNDGALSDRDRRQERIVIQTETMLHHMSQAGWQNMIDKSSKIFETLLNDFMTALHHRANRAPDTGTGNATMPSYHIAYLLERLDWNGFYSKQLGGATTGGGLGGKK